jgi:hypothetical protein
LLWSFAPHHGWRFQSSDAVLTLPGSHRSHLLRSHRARIFDQCLGLLPGGSRPNSACAPGHPSWGGFAAGSRPSATPFAANRHSIDGRSMLPPPAATQSPLPTHSRDPTTSATGSVGSASRHDQPRQRGAADVSQAHASPAALASYAPDRPESGRPNAVHVSVFRGIAVIGGEIPWTEQAAPSRC